MNLQGKADRLNAALRKLRIADYCDLEGLSPDEARSRILATRGLIAASIAHTSKESHPHMSTDTEHLHVSQTGALMLCAYPDLDEDTEYEQLAHVLSARDLPDSGSLEELRHEVIAAFGPSGPVPVATRPTCFYANGEAAEDGEGCDQYRFWLEPFGANVSMRPAAVCGQHIVDWTSDHAAVARWLLREELP